MADEMVDREYIERLNAMRDAPVEDFTDDELEILWLDLLQTLGRVNILCNLLMNRRKRGMPMAAIWCVENIKFALSHLRFFLDHRNDTPA